MLNAKPYIHDTVIQNTKILFWIPSLNSLSLSLLATRYIFNSPTAMSSVWSTTKFNRKFTVNFILFSVCLLSFWFVLFVRFILQLNMMVPLGYYFVFSLTLFFSITLNSREEVGKNWFIRRMMEVFVWCVFQLFDIVDLFVLVYQNGC